MSEVTTWNATDNANTAAPPDGWPEGMQPSAVNDTGRMMMGALKRYSQTVSAQIGSVAGTINTTTINATTISTTGAITASGPITGTAINSTGNGSIAGTLTAGNVSSGNINASGSVTANLDLIAHRNISCDGTVYTAALSASGDINAGGNTNVGGTVSATLDVIAHRNLQVDGTSYLQAVNVTALTSTGVINGNSLALTGGGPPTIRLNGWIYPFTDHQLDIGLPAYNCDAVYAYAYVTASDASLKTDIETPQGCLDLVGAIAPRTYRFRDRPDEAQHWGFVAQEVGAAMQAAGREFAGHRVDRESGAEGLVYPELVAVLWGAVKELTQQVEALKREKADV